MMLLYFFICFTPLLPDANTRITLGYWFCAFVAAYLLANFFIAVFFSVKHAWFSIRLYQAIIKAKQARHTKVKQDNH